MQIRFTGELAQSPRSARERLAQLAPAILLIAVAGACWALTVRRMQGMDMGPGTALGGLGWFAVVWLTMMAAMMLPSLMPMALVHARASRAAEEPPGAGAALFAAGYLLTWLAVGVLAYAVFDGVRSLDLSWLAWHRAGRYLAGGVIVAASLYKLTPLKSTCLRHCRNPRLLSGRWRRGPRGALATGVEHGGFCVGASWALMAALFALGVMSITWMIVVAGLVAIEKLAPWRNAAVWSTAAFIAALGLAVALAPAHVPGLTIPG